MVLCVAVAKEGFKVICPLKDNVKLGIRVAVLYAEDGDNEVPNDTLGVVVECTSEECITMQSPQCHQKVSKAEERSDLC